MVAVTQENEALWAELCCALWPENSPEDMLAERKAGKLPHEFLYLQAGEAVAFLSLSLRSDYVEGTNSSPVGYVEGIYVKPECRGQGVAAELLEFAKAWSRERGCRELASDCEIENTDSRAFHNAVGFSEASVNIHFTMEL